MSTPTQTFQLNPLPIQVRVIGTVTYLWGCFYLLVMDLDPALDLATVIMGAAALLRLNAWHIEVRHAAERPAELSYRVAGIRWRTRTVEALTMDWSKDGDRLRILSGRIPYYSLARDSVEWGRLAPQLRAIPAFNRLYRTDPTHDWSTFGLPGSALNPAGTEPVLPHDPVRFWATTAAVVLVGAGGAYCQVRLAPDDFAVWQAVFLFRPYLWFVYFLLAGLLGEHATNFIRRRLM